MITQRGVQRFILILALLALLGGALSCRQAESSVPRAWIDFPREGASFAVGESVTVMSHAYAREGVAEVMLLVDGEPYRRDAPAQAGVDFIELAQEWRPEAEGVYSLQVTSYAANGEQSNPATVSVTVVGALAEAPIAPTFTPTPVTPGPITPTFTPTPVTPGPITPTFTPTPVTPEPITPTWTPVTPEPITPTFTPTTTPTPPTPQPITPTFTPTFTPTPVTPEAPPPPEADVRIWAENESVAAGSCTRVYWHVSGVSAYWVNGQAGAGDDGSLQTCPCQDETHTLRAALPDGSEQNVSVTIRVSGECVTPETPPEPPSPPPAPSPNTPRNGTELGCVAKVALIWVPLEAPGGSIQYYVKLEREVLGKWQTVGGFGPTNDKQVTANVECGFRYRWTVRAEDGPGNYSDWAPWYEFTVTLT